MSRRDEIIAAATKYLEAIVSHDPRDVPFAAHAWRFEQGQPHGDTPDAIRAGLRASAMDVVTGMGPVRWIVEEASDQAVAFFEVSLADGGTCRLAERFRVRAGRIEEIEAIFTIDERPMRTP
ncbi:MAG TPA: hypothetical protein VFC77_09110 [Myxococcota bacterium]|nr:hypothetical protein [Myxococcota bacterium]